MSSSSGRPGGRLLRPALPVLTLGGLLVVWQVAVSVSHVERWLVPAPSDLATAARVDAGTLATNAVATGVLTGYGFTLGIAIGLLVAVALHAVGLLRAAVYPLLVISQNVPTIALAPLLVIWFGFGIAPKLIVIVLVCFFPVSVAALDGLARTDPVLLDYLRMTGASRWQVFAKLELPQALPAVFSGVKIAATYSVLGAVVAEWMGSDTGIGKYMLVEKSAFRTDRVFLAIAVVVALSLVLFAAVVAVERLVIRWQPARRGSR